MAKGRLNYETKTILELLFASKAHGGEACANLFVALCLALFSPRNAPGQAFVNSRFAETVARTNFDLSFFPWVLTIFYKNTSFIPGSWGIS